MLLIYLASPFSNPNPAVEYARYEAACRAAGEMLLACQMVFCPISHGYGIAALAAGMEGNWKAWQAFSREMISRCDELHVLTLEGWEQSVGVQAEIEIARELNLPVVFVCPKDRFY